MLCWKCLAKQELERNVVQFRATCFSCGFDLHVCKNCKYYYPGKPNDCSYPQTEHVSDREKYNFCEEFSPTTTIKQETNASCDEISSQLFGEGMEKKDNSFDDLIKND